MELTVESQCFLCFRRLSGPIKPDAPLSGASLRSHEHDREAPPEPTSGHSRHRALCRRARCARRRARRSSSCRPTSRPLGPSPRAVEAYREAAASLSRLSRRLGAALREAIGKPYGLDPARIVLRRRLGRAAHPAGASPICSRATRRSSAPMASLSTRSHHARDGAKPVVAPEKNLTADVDAMLRAVTPKTRIVFIANPNNPTGTYLPSTRCGACMPACPKTCCW